MRSGSAGSVMRVCPPGGEEAIGRSVACGRDTVRQRDREFLQGMWAAMHGRAPERIPAHPHLTPTDYVITHFHHKS